MPLEGGSKRIRLDECETPEEFKAYSEQMAADVRVFESLTASGFNMIDILAIAKVEAQFDEWPGVTG